MTIAYCWLDKSLSRERITAVSDSRISREAAGGARVPMQEETIKLFRVPVKCYGQEGFDLNTGAWKTPYFETELGLAFAGDCMEALCIANAFMRGVSQLMATGTTRPRPEPIKLYQMLEAAGNHWLSTYKKPTDANVHFLLFGYSPVDGKPWAGRLIWPERPAPGGNQFENPLVDASIFVIGAHTVPTAGPFAEKLRRLIQNQAGKKMNVVELQKAGFEPDLERVRLLHADSMTLEQDVVNMLVAAAQVTIGGTMQKLEVFPETDGRGVVAFCRDDVVGLPHDFEEAAEGLIYVSSAQRMGWAARPTPSDDSFV